MAMRNDTGGRNTPVLSFVVPMHNEEDNVGPLLERLVPIVEDLLRPLNRNYEIVCVDDGSSDATLATLREHRARNPALKIISLSRKFGKDIAMSAGIEHATGAAVIPLDADLQDPPELIPAMFDRWLEGYDMVYATRSAREADSGFKRVSAGLFYRVHNALAEIDIPHDTGDFRLMDRRVVAALNQLPERNRFMKGLFSWVGFRQCAVEYRREGRASGRSKWKVWQLWNFGIDGIASSSTVPLRVWSYVGLAIFLGAFGYAAFLIVRTLVSGVDVPGYASLMVAILFMGGITLLTLGIIGEYLGRIYIEVKQRPLYLIRETHGLEEDNQQGNEWKAKSTPEWRRLRTGTGGS